MSTTETSIVVLIERNSGHVWAQGETLEAAQTACDSIDGSASDWREGDSRDHDFIAYSAPSREYGAADFDEVKERGELIAYLRNSD